MTSSGQSIPLGKGGSREILNQTVAIANYLRDVDKLSVLNIRGREWRIPTNSEIRKMRVRQLREVSNMMAGAALDRGDLGGGGNPGDHPIANSWSRIQALGHVEARAYDNAPLSFYTEAVSDVGSSAPDEPPPPYKKDVPEIAAERVEWVEAVYASKQLPTDPQIPTIFSQVDMIELINGDASISKADAKRYQETLDAMTMAVEPHVPDGAPLIQGGSGGSMIPSAPVLDIADEETSEVPIDLWVDADSLDDQPIGADPFPSSTQASEAAGVPITESKYDEVNNPSAAGMGEQPWIGGEQKTPEESGEPAPYDLRRVATELSNAFLPASQSSDDRAQLLTDASVVGVIGQSVAEAKRMFEAGTDIAGQQLSSEQMDNLRTGIDHGTRALEQAQSAGGLGEILQSAGREAVSQAAHRLGGEPARAMADAATDMMLDRSGTAGDLVGAPAVASRDMSMNFGSSALEHGPWSESINDQLSRLWISSPLDAHRITQKIRKRAVRPVSTKYAHDQVDMIRQAVSGAKSYENVFNTSYS
jgi:hypothetical protein